MHRLQESFAQRNRIFHDFFAAESSTLAGACREMSERFLQGGRLLAIGQGSYATDAQHVSVEFVHPVIVGKRALPALALTNEGATLSGLMAGDAKQSFARMLAVLGRPEDMAMGFSPDGNCANVVEALSEARRMGMLTLGLAGGDGGLLQQAELDFCFVVRSHDPFVVQETHETLYHVLWELVHVFFEHEGLL